MMIVTPDPKHVIAECALVGDYERRAYAARQISHWRGADGEWLEAVFMIDDAIDVARDDEPIRVFVDGVQRWVQGWTFDHDALGRGMRAARGSLIARIMIELNCGDDDIVEDLLRIARC